jgi:PAS domain S-box-containing protein
MDIIERERAKERLRESSQGAILTGEPGNFGRPHQEDELMRPILNTTPASSPRRPGSRERTAPAGSLADRTLAVIAACHSWPLRWRLAVAVAIVFAAAAIRVVFLGALETRLAYVTLSPAVALAAIVGGLHGGVLATILCATIAHVMIAPLQTFADWLGLATFLVSCTIIVGMAETLHVAQDRLVRTENIERSEQQLRLFIAQAPAAVAMFDRHMRYMSVSDRWLSTFELDGRDLRGMSHYDVSPEIANRWREIHRRVLDGEVLWAEEEPFPRADGRKQWLRWEARPWRDATGQIAGIIIFSEDITDRKHAEFEIKKFVALADNSAEFISMRDMNFTPSYVNEAGLRIVGLDDAQQYKNTPFKEFFFPEDRDFITNEFIPRVLRDGRAEVEIRFRHFKTNEALWMIYNVFYITDGDGHPIGLATVSRNITDRKRAEDALRESEARYRAIVDTAVDVIVVIDESARVQSVNPAIQRVFGYASHEVVGQNVNILMPAEVAAAHDGYIEAYKRTGARKIIGIGREVEGRRRDGSKFPLDLSIAEWRDTQGARLFVGIMRDITERNQAQRMLAQAQRLEAVGQLAGGIAHDFNNLLAAITGNLELAERIIRDEKARQWIRGALEAIEKGKSFNQRLLSLACKRELAPVHLVVNCRIPGMATLLTRTLGEHIELTTDLAPDLWPTLADPGEIDSAILNLAVNARDAMPEGGKLSIQTRNVTLDLHAASMDPDAHPGDYVQLSVIDTGAGMSEEVLQHAIEPFFTTKEPGKGTGLGLSSVFGFAKQSGGFVTLASEVGKGTTVNLYLPRAMAEPMEKEARLTGSSTVPQGDGELILVVEDDDLVREATLQRLEALGYTVIEARSGPEAIERLKSDEPIALVFSDITMPGRMTGHDLARWVLAAKPYVKVLLTSGYNAGRGHDGRDTIAHIRVLAKPYTLIELARSIREALDTGSAYVGLTSPVKT